MSVSLAEALRILASSENVTELDLSYDGIADEGAKALAAALERNSTVKSLDLTCNGIGAEGAEALAAALERNSTVESLDLYYNGIGDEGAEALAAALERNSTVKSLDLWGNGIGAGGAKALAAALERNSTVKSLNLRYNSIGSEGGKALAESLQVQGVAFWLASEKQVLAFAQVKEALDLRGNYLKTLPAKVLQLLHLETLDVSNNHLRTLPCEVGQLTCLCKLMLSNNRLEALPVELLSICGLEMQVDTTAVQLLAEVLKSNIAIAAFDLTLKGPQGAFGADVDKALATALQVTGHGFWFKQQQRVLAFAQCDKIKDLDLRHNFLETLPAKVLQLLHLETLDVSNNHLRTLPCEVGQLTCLCKLMLSNNRLEALPVELLSICGLEMQVDTTAVQLLAEVLKSNIAIAAFDLTLKGPQGAFGADVDKALATALQVTGHGFWFKQQQRVLAFAQCDKIKDLDLRHNFLETLPSKVLQLLHLETLVVSNNHLRTLPCEVGQLTWLRTLKVDSNVLEKLPMHELLSLPRLKSLACKGNRKLCWPPQEIVRRGGRDVVKYLRLDTSRSVAFCMLTHHRLGQGQLVSRDAGAVLTPAHRHSLCLPTEILRMVLHSANDVAFLEVLLEKVEESDGASESDQEEEEEEESD